MLVFLVSDFSLFLFFSQPIPMSPVRIKVDPSHDASKVKAEGPGLNRSGDRNKTYWVVFKTLET